MTSKRWTQIEPSKSCTFYKNCYILHHGKGKSLIRHFLWRVYIYSSKFPWMSQTIWAPNTQWCAKSNHLFLFCWRASIILVQDTCHFVCLMWETYHQPWAVASENSVNFCDTRSGSLSSVAFNALKHVQFCDVWRDVLLGWLNKSIWMNQESVDWNNNFNQQFFDILLFLASFLVSFKRQ